MIIKEIYTLEDMLNSVFTTSEMFNFDVGTPFTSDNENAIKVLVDTIFNGTTLSTLNINGTESNNLFCTYVAPKYFKCYIAQANKDDDIDYKEFLRNYVNIFNLTYPKYKKLLDLYEDEEENLMNQLTSETSLLHGHIIQASGEDTTTVSPDAVRTHKESDTPQSSASSFDIDTHTSIITQDSATGDDTTTTEYGRKDTNSGTDKTTVKSDIGTVMSRLDEIQTAYRNLYNAWSMEFAGLFFYE